jgi:hypothetical protein
MRWRGTVPVSLGSRSEAEEQGNPAPPKEKQTPVQQELVASNHFANQPSLARVAHKHAIKSKYSGPSGSLKGVSNPEEVDEDQTYCRQARLAIADAGIVDCRYQVAVRSDSVADILPCLLGNTIFSARQN